MCINIPKMGKFKTFINITYDGNNPKFFVLEGEDGSMYICNLYADMKKLFLAKTNPAYVLDLLRNRLSLRDIFVQYPHDRLCISKLENVVKFMFPDHLHCDTLFNANLPKMGLYIDSDECDYKEEIRLIQEKMKVYQWEF